MPQIKSEIINHENNNLMIRWVDLSDVGDARSLPSTSQNSEPIATQWDPSFPKPNIFLQSCNWIICQSSHTLETRQHISSSKFFKPLPESPDASSLANTDLFKDKLERIRPKFLPADSPDPFLFLSAPPPKLLSLKFTNSLLLLRVNNVPLT